MRDFERAIKAVGDPTRTRILKLLERGGLCVCQVQAVLGLAPSTISKHLALLKHAGLVEDRRDGKWIEYALSNGGPNPHASAVLTLLRGALDREDRVRSDRRRLQEVKRLPLDRLCALPPTRVPTPRRTAARPPRRKDPRRG